VGSAAVQLARARGAQVIAVTRAAKAGRLRELGAERTVDRSDDLAETLGESTVDVVIDVVGGPGFPALLEVLRPDGVYAVSGAIAGPLVELDLRTLYLKDLVLRGSTALEPGVFAALIAHIEAGRVVPVVAATFPLEHIVEAQQAFLAKEHVGKIVLTVAPR